MESRVSEDALDWRDEIFTVFKRADIRQVGYVPDAGHARLIELCRADPAMRAVALTSEEEGVALLAGAWLGGQRGALLMQSSGVGNCSNMLSMTKTCRFPLTLQRKSTATLELCEDVDRNAFRRCRTGGTFS